MTIGDLLSQSISILKGAGIEDARSDVYAIISEFTNLSSTYISVSKDKEIDEEISSKIIEAVERLKSEEPVAYILGKAYFFNEEYKVGKGVLIPRPDTEILVEEAANLICKSGNRNPVIWDLCTGSGCIGISLTNELSKRGFEAKTFLVDNFDEALEYTRENLKESRSKITPEIVKLDVLNDLSKMPSERPDFIVSNPPYITAKDMEELDISVKDFEPHSALYGLREDGLLFYEVLAKEAYRLLNPNGLIIVEHGYDQETGVNKIFTNAGLKNVYCIKDFGGNPRVTVGGLNG